MPINRERYSRPYSQELQTAWANVLAYAWQNREFLDSLRENPAAAIERCASSRNGIQAHCSYILEQEEGVFGIPNPPEGLGEPSLTQEQLASLLDQDGLFGIIRGT